MLGMYAVYVAVMFVALIFLLSLGLLFTAVVLCICNYKTAIWRNLNALVLVSLALAMVLGLMVGYCYLVDLKERREHPEIAFRTGRLSL